MIFHGRYDPKRVYAVFSAVVPADKPRYLFMNLLVDAQGSPGTQSGQTAAWNAGIVTREVIEKTAPLLGIEKRGADAANPFSNVTSPPAPNL